MDQGEFRLMDTIAAKGISVRFDPDCGNLADFAITLDGKTVHPLHRAPWVDNGEKLPDTLFKSERKLSGDFFCAPFGRPDPRLPIHGWAANGTWEKTGTDEAGDATTHSYALREEISGAKLTKHLTVAPGHPVLYQRHVFHGGAGALPVAHHAMIRAPGTAKLSFSPKSFGRTMPTPLETDPARGRSVLAYPQEFASMTSVRRADGGSVDATVYPFDTGHEDLIVLSEKPDATIGWSAAVAREEGFVFFAVKDAKTLPQTVLWMSNGGRSYAPWNSRHTAVLGIEEGAVAVHLNDNERKQPLRDGQPIALALKPQGEVAVRHALGGIPVPQGWSEVTDIRLGDGTITLADRSGDQRELPFLTGHFS